MNQTNSIAVLIILYLVGFCGIAFNIHESFILLTPFNLLISLALVLWNHDFSNSSKERTRLSILIGLCFFIGFFIEVLGVQTGQIFGTYEYGPVLGWKVFDTPLMIGVNWAMLVYCSGVTVNHIAGSMHNFGKALIAAGMMLGLDFLIGPVAIHYDFWQWEDVAVPLKNYIAWFVIAFFLLLAFYQLIGRAKNKVGVILFILQVLFFGSLCLFLNYS